MRRTDEIENAAFNRSLENHIIGNFLLSCLLAGAVGFVLGRALFTL